MADISRATLLRAATVGAAGVAASVAVPRAAEAGEHPNVALIRGYYAAYAAGDLTALRERYFAPGIRWTIPGHHPLAGTKEGVDEVLAFFAELARAGFRAETIFLAADGDWVVDLHRGWSTRPKGLDIMWALAFRVERNRIAEAVNYPGDQHAADAYFWKRYPLADLPGRLAPRA
ncbi:SnoaL-like domain protein [Actinomadura rubteroloni]|uniref:SnoaL-like domain protein n=1 Tax=Actinomadura rubteroloni TaxID=1926885 RepID=A0A2P4ULM2_9ACTN|nr:nuclear transport factor 2 family protein [Actinomadura rubteroloni]POM25945.1 SnoaL-like domain protein [Actinomadura rubteroloni]